MDQHIITGIQLLPFFCLFQEYSEWKKGVADVHLPSVYINRMDYLTSYVRAVTDATEELCDLILTSYRDKLSMFCKGGEFILYYQLYIICALAALGQIEIS